MRIEDYAVIGDTWTAGLIGRDGSVDWLCLPRFDSGACFAAVLGGPEHGRWRIAPAGWEPGEDGDDVEVVRSYLDRSLVLQTEFRTPTGVVRLVDCMPAGDGRADLVRSVVGVQGQVQMEMEWVIRFDYGRIVPWVRRVTDPDGVHAIVAVAGPDAACLRGSVMPSADSVGGDPAADDPGRRAGPRHVARFAVSEGERLDFSMTWFPSHHKTPSRYDVPSATAATRSFWTRWADRCEHSGPDGGGGDAVVRSLLVLKALTFGPTGGIVAAPTTSLPEHLGGERNWDYRYCWLRDASLTLRALLHHGYRSEARHWRDWLLRAVAGDPADLQIMYGIGGERRLPEAVLDWLPGYEDSRPVRIGNAASVQFQADAVGHVMDALETARLNGLREDDFSWPLQRALIGYLEDNDHRADHGMWEIREDPRYFTHSRVMVWAAYDRAVRAVTEHGLDGPAERWAKRRDDLRAEILERAWDPDLNSYTQYYGSGTTDAALLLLPSLGFLPADDPRWLSTLDAVQRELRQGAFVLRYRTAPVEDGHAVDGLPPGEGAFLACSFWLVRALAQAGRTAEAHDLFDELLGLANDVGLYAEEYDPASGRMLGNMPQAFSHLALVEAARVLARTEAPPKTPPD